MRRHTLVRPVLHAVWAAAVVAVLALNLVWPLPGQEQNWPWVGGLVAFPVTGAILLMKRPGNGVGRALAAVGVIAGLIFMLSWYALSLPDAPWSRQLEAIEAGAAVLQFVGIIALLYVFPTGRTLPGWHRVVFRGFVGLLTAVALAAVLNPAPLPLTGRVNPFGVGPHGFAQLWERGFLVVPVGAVAGVASLVARLRRAAPVERAQLRWFVAGAALFAVMIALAALTPDGDGTSEAIAGVVMLLAFWAVPVAVLVAVTRYQLYEIERLVSRAISYAVVASILAAVYALCIVGLQAALPDAGSDLVVAASTLAASALFTPVRRVVRRGLDRRFNRERYNAEHEIGEFARRLRDELDLDTLVQALGRTADRTVQPTFLGIWLRPIADGAGEGNRTPIIALEGRGSGH